MDTHLPALEKQSVASDGVGLQVLRSESLFLPAAYSEGGPALGILPFLFWVIEKTAPRRLVCFDPHPGEAYFGLCQAIDHNGLTTEAFNITDPTGLAALAKTNGAAYARFSTLLDAWAEPVIERFEPACVDVIYIELNEPPQDLQDWREKLSPGCIVLVHGAKDPERQGALGDVLSQLQLGGVDFTLAAGNGLAVALGSQAPAALQLILQETTPGHAEAHHAFIRLGQAQVDAHAVRSERAARRTAEVQLEEMRQAETSRGLALQALDEKTVALERAHAARLAEVEALKALLGEAGTSSHQVQDRIAELEAALRLKDHELRELRETSSEKIEALESKCTWLRKEAAKTTANAAELKEARSRRAALEDDLARLTKSAHGDKAASATRIQDLETRLAQAEAAQERVAKSARANQSASNAQISELKEQLETRVEELVALTQLFETEVGTLRDTLRDRQEWHEIQMELRDAEIAMRRGARGLLRRGDPGVHAGLPSLKQQVALLTACPLFDAEWYRQTYPDVAEAAIDPARHYVLHGALDGRNPSPQFDTMSYYRTNRDVARSGMNALVHYEMFGRDEGRGLHRSGD
ncbi:MAG: hypothetical protein AAFM92_12955 [Pseudomonadota bacterium]